MVVAGLAAVGLFGLIGVRVHEAKGKQAAIAAERATAQATATQKAPARSVHPVALRWRPHVDLTGTLRPWREADIGFELSGRLVRLGVAEGDKVKVGTTLAVLDATRAAAEVSAAQAQARAAEASVAIAEDTERRTEALVKSGSIPEAQIAQSRSQLELAKAQLSAAQANAQVAQTGQGLHTLAAPFAALVTKAPTAAGSVVQPGSPLFRLEDLSRLRLSGALGEGEASLVRVGASVTVNYRDRQVTGKLITLVPSLDPATRRAPVEIEVPNDPKDPLLANGFVHATIQGDHEVAAFRVPPTARRPGSQDEVVKFVDGKAQVVHVPHVADGDGSWIVLEGVSASDVIVLNPPDDVRNGDPLDVAAAQ
ncbi:MAG TPA: efflux RND transporter periplasmic adaptor subunit [Polyangiaceae bacterium]|jgi:RND family efflux transporter MFP subunit